MTMHQIAEWIGHEIDVTLDLLEGPHDAQSMNDTQDIGPIMGGTI